VLALGYIEVVRLVAHTAEDLFFWFFGYYWLGSIFLLLFDIGDGGCLLLLGCSRGS